jgi:hypothetical protein
MTSAPRYGGVLDDLRDDVAGLARLIQGLVVYDVVAPGFYGFTVPQERHTEIHIRPMERMLDAIVALDNRSLSLSRPVDKRLAGRCHHFMLLMVGILRRKGVPARMRCGFGSYFNPPHFEDHWICEYWNAMKGRWTLVDVQFDEVWRTKLKINHDILDVPRDRFLVAADAWTQCRGGVADPNKFGIEFAHLRGLWYVAGNLIRDIAALNKVEMLPWDVWGAQPRPNETLDDRQLAFFDHLAELTREPDGCRDELRTLFEMDGRVKVPETVFNALLNRSERISG